MSNTDKAAALGGPTPSPESSPTISPAEFGVILDLAANSSAPVGRVLALGDLFQRAVKLANQAAMIGAIHDSPVAHGGPAEGTYADKHRLNKGA